MRNFCVTLLLCFVSGMALSKNTTSLEYQISISAPQTHYAEITVLVKNSQAASLHFRMPVWTPGSYLIREFEKSVELAKAWIDEKECSIQRPDKNTWLVEHTQGHDVLLKYRVYAFEPSVRTSFIDADHAFLHNTSIFMYVEECMQLSGTIQLQYPVTWQNLTTGLDSTKEGKLIFDNYDHLADCPIEIGNHDLLHFSVMGVPHTVALVGSNNCDQIKFAKDLEKMCLTMAEIIGEHPCKKYVFIVHNVENGGGGLEHTNSCCVWINRWNWTDAAKYRSFLGLCAHEYFHLWNVKRLHPIELGPFNYNAENYTDQLWVAEGITSYYDELSLLRAGHVDREAFVNTLEEYVNTLENRPGCRVQTLAESSRDAWIKEYRQNENSKNTTISYYSKGLVVAALLDAAICEKTKGEKHLDDLMRLLYQRFYKEKNRGFSASEFMEAASEIAGENMVPFFTKHIYSLEKPDYGKIFSSAGMEVNFTENEEYKLGITTALENGKTIIKYVTSGSAAWLGGLNVNDQLLAVNGSAVNNDADQVLKNLGSPGTVKCLVNRSGLVREITFEVTPLHTVKYDMYLNTSPGNYSKAQEKWLGKP